MVLLSYKQDHIQTLFWNVGLMQYLEIAAVFKKGVRSHPNQSAVYSASQGQENKICIRYTIR